jgi:hypothetical protein
MPIHVPCVGRVMEFQVIPSFEYAEFPETPTATNLLSPVMLLLPKVTALYSIVTRLPGRVEPNHDKPSWEYITLLIPLALLPTPTIKSCPPADLP